MRKKIISCLIAATVIISSLNMTSLVVKAETDESTKAMSAVLYEFDEDGKYNLSDGAKSSLKESRLQITGKIDAVSTKGSFTSYSVDVDIDDNLTITSNGLDGCPKSYAKEGWEITEDKSKEVGAEELDDKILSGALVIQTSKDGKVWNTAASYTDIFGKNKLENTVYETTNVQLTSGCYYRLIVSYKLKKQAESSKILFVNKENYDYKKVAEVYEFYAYNKNVDTSLKLDTSTAYELGNLVRCADAEGYSGEKAIDNEDPHNGWEIGKFYINGYTAKTEMTDGTPIFLKEVGDKTVLWFNLEQELNNCDNKSVIKVVDDTENYDQFFGTKTMDFGKGTLIIRKTDSLNKKTVQIYRDYLEASATPGANVKVDLFEEGDYEVALDYALKYDKTKVFNQAVLPKTLHYRVSFTFSVRNGDCKLFVRDAKTDQFINNGNVAENGFYIDLAKQAYLKDCLTITREVMSDSLDGLVADTKFNGAGQEGRVYTDEGIYTIKATNKYTSATTEKKIYVGNTDVLKAYMNTGLSIPEINEKLAKGAYIDDDGNIIEPNVQETIVNELIEVIEEPEDEIVVKDVVDEKIEGEEISNATEQTTSKNSSSGKILVVIVIALVLAVWLISKQKSKAKQVEVINSASLDKAIIDEQEQQKENGEEEDKTE